MKTSELDQRGTINGPGLDQSVVNFDPVDDLLAFMQNNLLFYRKVYYPTMIKISNHLRRKKKISLHKEIKHLVDKAIVGYFKTYKLNVDPEDLFTDEHCESVISQIIELELPLIKKGEYK